jgi:DNA polymerase-3 subunit gamma/tau
VDKALYRKYRPRSFDEVIGQRHITFTLQNQIKHAHISHAYLFCGSRGVGKTSLARIFARAINCENPLSAPCEECETCKKNSALDIIEIDAASNNGVDDARDLREKVQYPPVSGKFKVYIIDEVHMLSGSAFNTLLKTLEEPPAHAVFILATTDPQKLPPTILSRCQRHDFRLLPMPELCKIIANIYKNEGKEADEDAVRAIAAAAEGSVRDAISLADTAMNFSEGKLMAQDVEQILGISSKNTERLLQCILSSQIKDAFTALAELASTGKSMTVVAKELMTLSREIMVAKVAPELLETTNERTERLVKMAGENDVNSLAVLVRIFGSVRENLRYSPSPRAALEATILSAMSFSSLDLAAMDIRLCKLERLLQSGKLSNQNASAGDFEGKMQLEGNIQQGLDNNFELASGTKENNQPFFGEPVDVKSVAESENNNNFYTQNDVPFVPSASKQQAVDKQMAVSERTPAKPISSRQLWGRIITYFRKNSTPVLLTAVGNQNIEKIQLTRDMLTIFCQKDDFLLFCSDEMHQTMVSALLSEGISVKINIEKDTDDIDIERAIKDFKMEFGKERVKIKD